MKSHLRFIFLTILLTVSITANGAHFYLDPINGDIANDGSMNNPLPDLEAVIDAFMIQSRSYTPLPYQPGVSELMVKNQGGLIQAGDTLFLMDGLHGEVFLRAYFNTQKIHVIGLEKHTPLIRSLRIQGGKNWNFQNITISSEPYGMYDNYRLVFFENHGWHGPISNIEISNSNLYSTTVPWTTANDWLTKQSDGIYADGDSMLIKNNSLINVGLGISLLGDDGIVSSNEIINFSRDGIRVLGSDGLYENNLIKNCYKVDENHDDGIQSFTVNGYVVDRNIIRANVIINSDNPQQPLRGSLQGIGCFDGFYHDWIIENNLIIVDHWHGLSLYGARNCKIINNTVLDPSPDITPGAAWIRINPHKYGTPSSDNIVANNVANQFVIDGGELFNNATLIDYVDYESQFIDHLSNDFDLKSESSLIDMADITYATSHDIDGIARSYGIGPDIGAYEYNGELSSLDKPNEKLFQIFPNPTDGIINFNQNDQVSLVEIIDIKGSFIQKIELENTSSMTIAHLPKGMYLFRMHLLNKNQIRTRIVVHQ